MKNKSTKPVIYTVFILLFTFIITSCPQITNRPPIADAGPDQTGVVGVEVTFDGSNSSDPDGDSISFYWTLATYPESTTLHDSDIRGNTTSFPSLTPDIEGVFILRLTVSDYNSSDYDHVKLTVTASSITPTPDTTDTPTPDPTDIPTSAPTETPTPAPSTSP